MDSWSSRVVTDLVILQHQVNSCTCIETSPTQGDGDYQEDNCVKRHSRRDAPTCHSHLTAFLHERAVPSLIPRPLPDFISQPWRKINFLHGCKIKSWSGLGTRLNSSYISSTCPGIADELAVAHPGQWVAMHSTRAHKNGRLE